MGPERPHLAGFNFVVFILLIPSWLCCVMWVLKTLVSWSFFGGGGVFNSSVICKCLLLLRLHVALVVWLFWGACSVLGYLFLPALEVLGFCFLACVLLWFGGFASLYLLGVRTTFGRERGGWTSWSEIGFSKEGVAKSGVHFCAVGSRAGMAFGHKTL